MMNRTFPKRDAAKQQTEKILEAIRRCENEITSLEKEHWDEQEKGRIAAGLQFLGGSTLTIPEDQTGQKIAALKAAAYGLKSELAAAKTEEDRALLTDLQEWAATLEPETRALVERGTAIRKELKDITGRLRILHQDSRLINDWWARAVSRIQQAERATPTTGEKRPLPPRPRVGTIPQGLLND